MKIKYLFYSITLSGFFVNCENDSVSDITVPVPETVKYTTNIKPIIQGKCISCHNTGSNNGEFTNYQQTKDNINGILVRIQKENGDNQLMPQGGPKLSQADINLFLKWQADGLLE